MKNVLEAQDAPNIDYLYDFFYVDTPRISSFYSHFEDSGVLTTIKKSDSEDTTLGSDVKADAKIISYTGKEQSLNKSSYEETYDSSLVLPITTIELLSEHGFIHDDITGVHLGQLILMRGKLSLIDFRIMQGLWDVAMRTSIEQQLSIIPKTKRHEAERVLTKEANNTREVLKQLPHTITLTLSCGDENLYAVLNPNHLRIEPETIALSHGASVLGDWYMLGLVDAYPDNYLNDNLEVEPQNLGGKLTFMMEKISTMTRQLLGRPTDAYGVTPVTIFRKVIV